MTEEASTTIDPEALRKELANLWVHLAKEPEQSTHGGVLRACSMTLIAGVDEHDDPSEVGETLASLMREHPSRAIVLRLRDTEAPWLSSRVFAQCWMPFGYRRQICCEQIEITASAGSLLHVSGVIQPLVVADLPVMFWCQSVQLFQLPAFAQLAPVAQKIMVDSGNFHNSQAALLTLQSFGQRQRVADLAWTRTTRWRELLAQIFENRSYLATLPQVTHVTVVHQGAQPPSWALYLGVWVQQCVGKVKSQTPALQWQGGEFPSVLLMAGDTVHTSIRLLSETAVETSVQGQHSRAVFPLGDYASLLREELSIPEEDPVFASVLKACVQISSNGS